MPFAFPGEMMPDHVGRRNRRLEGAWGYAPATGGGVPANALTLRDGSPITLRDNSYLTTRAS